jgi:hypothetical protein
MYQKGRVRPVIRHFDSDLDAAPFFRLIYCFMEGFGEHHSPHPRPHCSRLAAVVSRARGSEDCSLLSSQVSWAQRFQHGQHVFEIFREDCSCKLQTLQNLSDHGGRGVQLWDYGAIVSSLKIICPILHDPHLIGVIYAMTCPRFGH